LSAPACELGERDPEKDIVELRDRLLAARVPWAELLDPLLRLAVRWRAAILVSKNRGPG
jgi:hypothetical protein